MAEAEASRGSARNRRASGPVRVPIPADLIPDDASVEMEAKKAAGYFTPEAPPTAEELKKVKGRDLDKF